MRDILRLSIPMTLWLAGFSAVYALQGMTCSRHWVAGPDPRFVLLVAFALLVLVQGAALLAVLGLPSRSRFVQATATILAWAALGAAIWTALPTLAMSVCS